MSCIHIHRNPCEKISQEKCSKKQQQKEEKKQQKQKKKEKKEKCKRRNAMRANKSLYNLNSLAEIEETSVNSSVNSRAFSFFRPSNKPTTAPTKPPTKPPTATTPVKPPTATTPTKPPTATTTTTPTKPPTATTTPVKPPSTTTTTAIIIPTNTTIPTIIPPTTTTPTTPTTPTTTTISQIKKNAILIGLNYPGSYYALNGCINDVKNGGEYLKNYGFSYKILTDSEITDKYNVLEALHELKTGEGKTLFFHYSGHGTTVRDTNADETDGNDEAIYSKGDKLILDDQIAHVLSDLSEEKFLIFLADCCHSGSICDLPYIHGATTVGGVTILEEKIKKTFKGEILLISGCLDAQTSADVTENGKAFGALSATFYGLLRKYDFNVHKITWKEFHDILVKEMKSKGYSQTSRLSASHNHLFDRHISF